MTDFYQHSTTEGDYLAPDPAFEGQTPVRVAQNSATAAPAAPAAVPSSPQEEWTDVTDEQWSNVPLERDIDTKSGSPFSIRLEMARAKNPDEAKLVLDKYYGAGNYGQDRSGNWWAMQDGKPTAVFPSGNLPVGESRLPSIMQYSPLALLEMGTRTPSVQNMAAHVGAAATPIAGATAGAAIGAPAGPLGSAAGAGVGAAAGFGIDQLVKWYRGLYSQSPEEVTKNASKEALLNSAMTGAGPIMHNLGTRAGQGFRNWTGVTPTSARMTQQLTDDGARPPIRSVAPEFKSLGEKQILRDAVMGNPQEARNVEYIQNRFRESLRASGVPDNEIDDLISAAAHPTIAPSETAAGELAVAGAQRHIGNLQAEMAAGRQEAQRILRGHEQTLRTWAEGQGRNMEGLSPNVAEALIGQRVEFGRAMGRQYKQIDERLGGDRVFNLEPAWQRVRQMIDLANPDQVPPYLHRMMRRYDDVLAAREEVPKLQQAIQQARAANQDVAQLEAALVQARTRANGNMTTFSEGHEIRTNLRQLMDEYEFNPTRDAWTHKLGRVEDAVDDTFRAMENAGGVPGQVAQALRLTDDQYRHGIAVFKDAQVRRLIRDIRDGAGVDPESVASTILREGHTASGRRLLNMLPQDLRENVARADMRNILEEASVRDPTTGQRVVDGLKLLDALENRKRATLLRDLHTPQALDLLRSLGSQLAGLDGKIALDAIPAGHAADAIRAVITRQNQLNQFVVNNPIGALTKGTPEQVDRAVNLITTGGNEAMTVQAARFFGVNSPEWEAIQRSAMRHLMRTALVETPNARLTVSGPGVERALKGYTAQQQELLFPAGLADDLREVAKQAKFLFPQSVEAKQAGHSIAAANITLKMGPPVTPSAILADTRYVMSSITGWLADHPGMLRFLAGTARKNPSEARSLLGFLTRSVINGEMMGPGRGRPTPQEGEQ